MEQPQYDLPEPQLIIPLDPPISNGGGAVTELTLQEPTAAQVRAAESHLRNGVNPQSLRDYQLSLVTSVSGVSRQAIDKLPVSKLLEAADYLQGFISPPLKTGTS